MNLIVVGLDASERGPAVLEGALEVARKFSARLHIVRAVPLPAELPFEAMSIAADSLPETMRAMAQTSLEKQCADLPRELISRIEARVGPAWQVVCDVAEETKANLVVVGTHGYKMIDRLVGTTAARVVNRAPCSVMVIRNTP